MIASLRPPIPPPQPPPLIQPVSEPPAARAARYYLAELAGNAAACYRQLAADVQTGQITSYGEAERVLDINLPQAAEAVRRPLVAVKSQLKDNFAQLAGIYFGQLADGFLVAEEKLSE